MPGAARVQYVKVSLAEEVAEVKGRLRRCHGSGMRRQCREADRGAV